VKRSVAGLLHDGFSRQRDGQAWIAPLPVGKGRQEPSQAILPGGGFWGFFPDYPVAGESIIPSAKRTQEDCAFQSDVRILARQLERFVTGSTGAFVIV